MLVARLIGKALPVVVNCWDVLLYLSRLRSKIQWLFLPPKRNISRREVVVLNCYRWSKHVLTMVWNSMELLSYVTMKVPSRLPAIQFNILEPSILISDIIFLETMWARGYHDWWSEHRWSIGGYIYQAFGWISVLQIEEWAKCHWLLKCGLRASTCVYAYAFVFVFVSFIYFLPT
jgi:hypothetical protein